ncbi:MAG: cohesin domain-containing protein [Ruminococcus sp.]
MKSLRARTAAILLVAAMGVSLTACSKDDADKSSVSGGNAEVSDNGENNGNADNNNSAENNGGGAEGNANAEENTEDPTAFLKQEISFGMAPGETADDQTQDPTEAETAVQTSPQTYIVTEKVVVTEAGGAAVTNTQGNKVTEVVTQVQTEEVTYVPAPKSEPIYWLDMTKSEDWVFDGDILTIDFKIKEGTPDGNYPLMFTSPDFVNWDEEQLDIKTVGGYVTVGNATPTQPDQVQPGQFTISTTSAKGNAGDVIQVSVKLSDNPGLVGMVVFFEYDSAALEYVGSTKGEALQNLK